MKTTFLDLDKIYNLHLDEKIVTPKHLPLQGFVIATLVNSFGRSTLSSSSWFIIFDDAAVVLILFNFSRFRWRRHIGFTLTNMFLMKLKLRVILQN